MIKNKNILILLIAGIVSVGLWLIPFIRKSNRPKPSITTKIFKGTDGWGYDILVGDSLFIHQEFVPALPGQKGFAEQGQAEKTAALIINKMKENQLPAITTFELEKISSLDNLQYAGP